MRRLALLALVVACRPPATAATPAAAKATVRRIVSASVHVTIRATVNVVSQEGLALRITDEDAGRVETDYFDLTPVAPEAGNYPEAERTVRFVFQIQPDTLGRGSILLASAVYRPFAGSGTESRRRERLVPPDHPGATYTKKLVGKIEETALGIERGN